MVGMESNLELTWNQMWYKDVEKCVRKEIEKQPEWLWSMESFWFWLVFAWYKMFKHSSSEEDMENVGFTQEICLKTS